MTRRRRLARPAVAVALACAWTTVASSVRAEVQPLGPEFRVNAYTTDAQISPATCGTAAGDFVMVWRSDMGDGSGRGIFGRRFASDGTPAGSEFVVNAYTTGDQFSPSVCCDPAGNFVATWSAENDGSGYAVRARRFASTGSPQGTEFQVNTYTTGDQTDARAACDAAGGFVVVWETPDGALFGISGQRFVSNGTPAGSEFRANAYTTGNQGAPTVAADPTGNFVIAWISNDEDGDSFGIFGRRYASTGATLSGPFRINSYTTSIQSSPFVAEDGAGNFVVVWNSQTQDGHNGGIFGQRFASDGTPRGAEFRVNTYTTNDQATPTVAVNANGDSIIVYTSYVSIATNDEVFAQRYDAGGSPLGTEFQVNTYTYEDQRASQGIPVAIDADGGFVIAWQSQEPGGQYEVWSRIYREQCGDGAPDTGEACDDGNRAAGDCCSAACGLEAAGTPCADDGIPCTADACDGNAACAHTAVPNSCGPCRACEAALGCVPRPRTDCRHPRRATLLLANRAADAKDQLAFGWQKGAATTTADFGNLPTAPDYTLCIFDRGGGADRLVHSSAAPAGGSWKPTRGKGFRFRSRAGALRSVDLKSGRDGKASVTVAGKGAALAIPPLGLTPPVEAQLQAGTDGACFAGTFPAARKNTAALFKAKGD